MTTSLLFRITGNAYQQMLSWQQETDQAVLRHQIETRGQALVVRLGDESGLQKVNTLPSPGEAEPYYGTVGGAYRYTFHPIMDGCELEVVNQMGGFAFFYPEPFPPLNLYLFQPVMILEDSSDNGGNNGKGASTVLFSAYPIIGEMHFRIPDAEYHKFLEWPWSRRPLHAYNFTFTPTTVGCLVNIRSRETGSLLELVNEEAF